MTSKTDLERLVDLNFTIQDLTGEYFDFNSIEDCKTFLSIFNEYYSNGYDAIRSTQIAKREMEI